MRSHPETGQAANPYGRGQDFLESPGGGWGGGRTLLLHPLVMLLP
ncbi:MAG: hypothetical protein QOK43_1109 [Acidimicrobiaceae bacterium]|nr:hypothetical protein [Acidimicrobiaceae bacterium]